MLPGEIFYSDFAVGVLSLLTPKCGNSRSQRHHHHLERAPLDCLQSHLFIELLYQYARLLTQLMTGHLEWGLRGGGSTLTVSVKRGPLLPLLSRIIYSEEKTPQNRSPNYQNTRITSLLAFLQSSITNRRSFLPYFLKQPGLPSALVEPTHRFNR